MSIATQPTNTPDTAAPAWPSLEQAEHAAQTLQTLAHGHLVHEGRLLGIGALIPESERVQARLAVLEAAAPGGPDTMLDDELALRRDVYKAIEVRRTALTENRAALQQAADAARAALAQAEDDMREATADQAEAARKFATHGNTGLLAAKARHERAGAAAEKATADLDMLSEAMEVVERDLQAVGAERSRRAAKLWACVSRVEYAAAGEGIRHLARAWAARSKSGDASLTMTQFVNMAFNAVLPSLEAQAALERQLREEFFPQ